MLSMPVGICALSGMIDETSRTSYAFIQRIYARGGVQTRLEFVIKTVQVCFRVNLTAVA